MRAESPFLAGETFTRGRNSPQLTQQSEQPVIAGIRFDLSEILRCNSKEELSHYFSHIQSTVFESINSKHCLPSSFEYNSAQRQPQTVYPPQKPQLPLLQPTPTPATASDLKLPRRSNSFPALRTDQNVLSIPFHQLGGQFPLAPPSTLPTLEKEQLISNRPSIQQNISPFTDLQANSKAYITAQDGRTAIGTLDESQNFFARDQVTRQQPITPVQQFLRENPLQNTPAPHYVGFIQKLPYHVNPMVLEQMGGIQDELRSLEPSFKANELRFASSNMNYLYEEPSVPFNEPHHRGPIGLSSNYMSGGSVLTFDPQTAALRNQRLAQGVPFAEHEANRPTTLDRLQALNARSPVSLGKSSRGFRRTGGSVHFQDDELNDRALSQSQLFQDTSPLPHQSSNPQTKTRQTLQSMQYFRAQREHFLQDHSRR